MDHHEPEPTVTFTRWTGPWPDDDPDANFKADVALYANADPLRTLRGMSGSTGIPVGALVRYVLARWASEGSSGLLELGPTMTRRLAAVCSDAEAVGTDEARVAAFHQLRQMISWLHHPLEHPEVYEEPIDRVHRARAVDGPAEARSYYARWAVNYDHDVFGSLGFVGHELVARVVSAEVPTTAEVLDLGCGTGAVGAALAANGFTDVDGLDLSPEMLRIAGHKAVYRSLLEADLTTALPLPSASWDAVASAGTFVGGHVGADALDEAVRLLRVGGVLVVTVAHDVWNHGFERAVERLKDCGALDVASADEVAVTQDGSSTVRLLVARRLAEIAVE